MKPNTDHTFTFDGEDKTSQCVQIRNNLNQSATSGLRSDPSGILVFTFYYDAGLDEARSDVEKTNQIIAQIAGKKTFKVQNINGSSKAEGSINMHYYTDIDQPPFNPVAPPAGIVPNDQDIAEGGGAGGFGAGGFGGGSGDIMAPPVGDQYWEDEIQVVGSTSPRQGVNIKRY